ncbi:hypothetical protein DPMN_128640 [Dreissena polymorpha]|uniref:Uncharacterized protein n=1 Tax=Dreissena polymorpha TaxID=45954 RepID=A0A9D4JVY5_DREPO|nr:hypothetical protein DPMN_128640 [Dreissena polymorpha]
MCMMVVVVGLGLNMILEGTCSPTAIFLYFLLGVFIIAAFMHPQVGTAVCGGGVNCDDAGIDENKTDTA